MAILITQARFTQEGSKGTTVAGAQEGGTISARKSVLRRTVWLRMQSTENLQNRELRCRIQIRSSHAEILRRLACAYSGETVTQFQTDSSRTDSPVRILYAQPGSPVSTEQNVNPLETARYRSISGSSHGPSGRAASTGYNDEHRRR
jgi:hypothetical protein